MSEASGQLFSRGRRFLVLFLIGASILSLIAYIGIIDVSYRYDSRYGEIQVKSFRLSMDWHRSTGNIAGILYIYGPMRESLDNSRKLLQEVQTDSDELSASNSGLDADIMQSIQAMIGSIDAGLMLAGSILDAAEEFLSGAKIPEGLIDGRTPMSSLLGKDVQALLGTMNSYRYFQLVRHVKELNAFLDSLYATRLEKLLDSVTSGAASIRQRYYTLRYAVLVVAVLFIVILVWQLFRLNRFLNGLAAQRGQELESTRFDLDGLKRELEDAQFQKTIFGMVTGVAHELSTPLGNCVTAATFMEGTNAAMSERLGSGNLGKTELERFLVSGAEGFALINTNLAHMQKQIDTFKKLATTNHDIGAPKIGLKGYLDQRIHALAPDSSFRISTSVSGEGDLSVDPSLLDSVFGEIFRNSVEHGEAGEMSVEATIKADSTEIRCIDNGKGVAADRLPRLAEPFFTSARSSKHMGLGLSIALSLVVHKLQGSMSFAHANPGLEVRIAIPLRNGVAKRQKPDSPDNTPHPA